MMSSPHIDNVAHGKRLCDAVYAFYEPKGQVDVEIVFIHSLELDGSKEAYWKTWLARDGTPSTCWPKTWLVEKFPRARILSLSYDANVEQTSTSGRMDLYSLGESLVQEMTWAEIGQHDCPVLFVCHGFGGLVAKQIVLMACENFQRVKEVQNLLRNLCGFYFYATPHTGVQVDFSPWNPFTSKGKSVSYLEVFNDEVGRLNSKFEYIRHEVYNNEWMCFNVGERHATLHGRVVVPESSAKQVGVRFFSVNANHFDICRPQSRIDSSYQSLTTWVSKVIKVHEDKQHCLLDLPNGLVGMDDKIKLICEKLATVSIIGLVGMGGIGKTTISKLVYNSQAKFYDKACFLEGVRSKEDKKDVASVEKELFLELCGIDCESPNHLRSIKQCIMGKRVLVVIDDVGDSETLKCLQVPTFQRSLSSGSQVIVTCRNRQVLENLIVMERLKHVEIMDVEFLNDSQALELFHFHVFGGMEDEDDEMKDFQGLARDIAKACCGLPLSLVVIGQHLRKQHVHPIGMRKDMWDEALKKLREVQSFDGGDENEVLWKRLKISYDDLTDDTKSMFLDYVCFFRKKSRQYLSEQSIGWIWDSPMGLQNLVARSLIKVGGTYPWDRSFTIHDQLRDMGRRIVRDSFLKQEARSKKQEAIRLWNTKEVVSFLKENEGSKIIHGISLRKCSDLTTLQSQEDPRLMQEMTIQRFDKLKLLDLIDCDIKVVEFFLRKGWKELFWLCLVGVVNMVTIEAIGFCTKLRVLQMRECDYLEELPTSIGKLVHLLELDLSDCMELQSLPHEIGHLKQLKKLQLFGCNSLKVLPPSVSQLMNLQYLGLNWCSNLVSMVEFETQMDHLYKLNLSECERLRMPFKSLGKLHQLRTLNMKGSYNLVIENPCESFGKLSRLEKLNLLGCNSLISGFRVNTFHGEHSQEKSQRLWDLAIENLSSRLQKLRLPIISCGGFLAYPKLKVLDVTNGFHLEELHASLGNLTQLECLKVVDDHPGYLRTLPNSMWGLEKLKVLKLHNLGLLDKLPNQLGHLSSLQTLELYNMTKLEELPTSLGQLSQLQHFSIPNCESLKFLPESLTSLTQLSQLTLANCKKLVELPTTLGQLSHLEFLELRGCVGLKQLPKSSTSLNQLSVLQLVGCDALEVHDANQKIILEELKKNGCEVYLPRHHLV